MDLKGKNFLKLLVPLIKILYQEHLNPILFFTTPIYDIILIRLMLHKSF